MSETNADIIDQIAAAVAQHIRPVIPLSVDLWDLETIARYLKKSPSRVRQTFTCRPDFPKPIRLPTEDGHAHPLWKALEVIAWAEAHREVDDDPVRTGRPRKSRVKPAR